MRHGLGRTLISWPFIYLFISLLLLCYRKYEWHKHGTCAAKAESLNSQHKYFSKALELYHKLDLSRCTTLTHCKIPKPVWSNLSSICHAYHNNDTLKSVTWLLQCPGEVWDYPLWQILPCTYDLLNHKKWYDTSK